jgi:thiol-disulfide isomerase/thioredoxin
MSKLSAARRNFALGAAAIGTGTLIPTSHARAQSIGEPLKLFPAPMIGGEMFTPEQFAGGVNLLYVWASWCSHCLNYLPVLQEKYEALKSKGFNILGLNVDDDLGKAERWMKTYKVSFPSIQLTNDYRQTYLSKGRRTPSWWIAGRDGNIVDSAIGGGAEFPFRPRKLMIDRLVG